MIHKRVYNPSDSDLVKAVAAVTLTWFTRMRYVNDDDYGGTRLDVTANENIQSAPDDLKEWFNRL